MQVKAILQLGEQSFNF